MILLEHSVKQLVLTVSGASSPITTAVTYTHFDKLNGQYLSATKPMPLSNGSTVAIQPPTQAVGQDGYHPVVIHGITIHNPNGAQVSVDTSIRMVNPETNATIIEYPVFRHTIAAGSSRTIPFTI